MRYTATTTTSSIATTHVAAPLPGSKPRQFQILAQVLHGRPARASPLWQSPCIVATLARSYRDFSLDYGQVQDHPGEEGHSSNVDIQHGLHQYGLPQQPAGNPFLQHAPPQHHHLQHHHPQHGAHHHLVQVTTTPEAHANLYQAYPIRHMPQQQQQQPPSPYGTPALDQYAPRGRKRSRPRDELQLDLQSLHALHPDDAPQDVQMSALTPHAHHAHYYTPQPAHQQQPATQHHHHRLPNTAPPHKMHRGSYGSDPSPPATSHGPPSVVGQEGMPPPAPRPRGPKLKFTPEDDSLLVELKEKKNLTWKQIAEFFPGRSSGTLQVRYCTKLKAKTTVWTDDMVRVFSFCLSPKPCWCGEVRARLDCETALRLPASQPGWRRPSTSGETVVLRLERALSSFLLRFTTLKNKAANIFDYSAGPKTSQCHARVRERQMAHHLC